MVIPHGVWGVYERRLRPAADKHTIDDRHAVERFRRMSVQTPRLESHKGALVLLCLLRRLVVNTNTPDMGEMGGNQLKYVCVHTFSLDKRR